MRPASSADGRRVRFVIVLYLGLFTALNLAVWAWYLAHRHGPHRFPLGDPIERFGDLVRFSGKPQLGTNPRMQDTEALRGTLVPRNYLPLAAIFYVLLLEYCAPYAVVVFAAIVLAGVTAAAIALWRRVQPLPDSRWYVAAAIFASALLGWGVDFTLMRGNVEGILALFVLLGAWLYARKRFTGSAIAFALACCIKPFALLWFMLFLRHRQFRAMAKGLAAGALATLASLLAFDRNPLRAWHSMHGHDTFFTNYVLTFRALTETETGHSVLESMKTIVRIILNHGINFGDKENKMSLPDLPLAHTLYHLDLAVTIPLGLYVLARVWKMPVLNQAFAIACVILLFPFVANDYTLTTLLVPMAGLLIFLLEDAATGNVRLSTGRMLWFALPCLWVDAVNPMWPLHGVLKCVALLALLAAAVSIPMPSTLFGEVGAPTRIPAEHDSAARDPALA